MSLKGLSHSFTPLSAAHVGPTTPTRVPFHLVHSYTYHSLPIKVDPFPHRHNLKLGKTRSHIYEQSMGVSV